ncbi:MAG: hypothetical protein M3132_06285 [Actinomycetia bacterium]|nr:hypothetical protein [Actinomycetes bacterium]
MSSSRQSPSVPEFLTAAVRGNLIDFTEHQRLLRLYRSILEEAPDKPSVSATAASARVSTGVIAPVFGPELPAPSVPPPATEPAEAPQPDVPKSSSPIEPMTVIRKTEAAPSGSVEEPVEVPGTQPVGLVIPPWRTAPITQTEQIDHETNTTDQAEGTEQRVGRIPEPIQADEPVRELDEVAAVDAAPPKRSVPSRDGLSDRPRDPKPREVSLASGTMRSTTPPPQTPAERASTRPAAAVEGPTDAEILRKRRGERKAEKRERRAKRGSRARAAASTAWDAIANDVTANIMTYLGVLLAIVVIFAFFAFGYFGDIIRIKNLRPLVELAVPLTLFGLAAVLRKRSGASLAATAVALIGALTVPVMLSAAFRDGSLCCPPDLNGPARWAGYAFAGLVSAGLYVWLAKREVVYAYLVGPAVWASVGALGLYVTFGISGYQLFVVTVAMGASLYIASRFRDTRWGTILAVPAARMATLGGPFVFVIAVVFAYGDLSAAGDLAFDDLSAPSAVAAWAAVALLGGASTSSFAWYGLPDKIREATIRGVRAAAYVLAAMAVVFTMGLGLPLIWAGPFIVGYGLFVYMLDRRFGGAGSIPLLVARSAVVVGSLAALVDPFVGFWTWSVLAVGAGLYLVDERFRDFFGPLLPHRDDQPVREWSAWVTLVGAVSLGAFSVSEDVVGVAALLVAAILAGLTRTARGRFEPLNTYATVPSLALTYVAFMRLTFGDGGLSLIDTVVVLALLAGAAAVVKLPWIVRSPVVALASFVAFALAIGDLGNLSGELASAISATAVGGLFILASLRTQWRSHAVANGIVGNLSLVITLGAMGDPAARIIGLAGIVILNALQGAAVERRACPFVAVVARHAPMWRRVVRAWPSSVAAVVLIPLAFSVSAVSTLDTRLTSTILLVVLAWAYAASVALRIVRSQGFGIGLSYAALALGIIASFPVSWLATGAVLSGSLVAMAIAAATRKPNLSLPGWILATTAVAFGAYSVGVPVESLNEWLFGWVALILLGVSVANGRPAVGGITSPWLRPPAAMAVVMIPAVTVFSLIDGVGVFILATIAAALFVFFGYRTRAAVFSVPVSMLVTLAYVDATASMASLVDDPVGWIPLIVSFAALAVVLPGRGSWRVMNLPSPGVLSAMYAVGAIALITSPATPWLPAMLLVWAALMLFTRFVFGVAWAQYAALVAFVGAGSVASDGWSGGSLVVAAVVVGVLSARCDGVVASAHRWSAAILASGGFVLLGSWMKWTPETTVLVALVAGAYLGVTSMILVLRADDHPGLRAWRLPLAAAGQAAFLLAIVVAVLEMQPTAVAGVLFVVFAIDGVLAGTYAIVRSDVQLAAVATALLALAYGSLAIWLPWSDQTAMATTVAIGAALAVLSSAIHLRPLDERFRMWWPGLAVAGHGMMWTAVGVTAFNDGSWVLLMAIGLAVESLLSATYVEVRKVREAAWIAVATAFSSVLAFGVAAGSSTDGLVTISFVAGVALAAIAVGLHLYGQGQRASLWWMPMAVIGHGSAAISVVVALDSRVFEAAMVYVSLVALFEAIVFAHYAVDGEREDTAWASTASLGLAAVSGVVAFDMTQTQFATAALVVGSVILVLWTYLMHRGTASGKVQIWLWPGLIFSEFALTSGGAILFDTAPEPAGSLAVAAVLAVNGAAIAVVADAARIRALAVTSVAFFAASFGFAVHAFGLSPSIAMVLIWSGTVVLGSVATWLSRSETDSHLMWATACLLVTPVGLVSIVAQAGVAGDDLLLIGIAMSSVTASAIVWLNGTLIDLALMRSLDSVVQPSLRMSAGLFMMGVVSLTMWYPSEAWVLAPLLLTAAIGIAAAYIWATDEGNTPALILWLGLAGVAQVGVLGVFDVLAAPPSAVLAVNSVGVLAVGILGVRHRLAMAGIVGLMVGLAGLVNDVFDIATHATVVLVAIAVLTVLESERLLRKSEGRECPDIFRILEWVAMAAPMILAAVEMLDDLNFGLLLVAEGVALTGWGFVSRTRRRVLVGLTGIVTAITIGIVLPVLSGVREGFGSGGWLIIGAVMAVVLIAAGSNISRYRATFGRRLDRLGSMMEDWE